MPWTFAHPAAIIPLRRLCPTHLNFAALAIGAITPDLGYYFGLFGLAGYAHTLPGSVAVCVPTGLLLLACFYLLRLPVWHLLPQPHRNLLRPLTTNPAPRRPGEIIRAVLSLLAGAWSHNAWDSLTHRSGWVVTEYPVLRETAIAFGSSQLPLYHLLQHLSTLLGVAALLATYYRWVRREGAKAFLRFSRRDRWRYASLAGVLLLSAAIAVPLAASVAQACGSGLVLRVFIFWSAVYGATLFISLLVLTALFFYVTRREV